MIWVLFGCVWIGGMCAGAMLVWIDEERQERVETKRRGQTNELRGWW